MTSLKILRTFIAFPIGEGLIEKMGSLQGELKKLKLDAKMVDPRKTHLTLKFLGDTPVSSLDKIHQTLEDIAKRHASFSMVIDTFGAFPNFRSPRVLWVGSNECLEEAETITEELNQELSLLGFEKEERKFTPHLTLARLRSLKNEKRLAAFVEGYTLPWKETLSCETLIHYKSTLTPQGALYEPLYRVALVS